MLLSTLCFRARRTALQKHETTAIPLIYSVHATGTTCHIICLPNLSTAVLSPYLFTSCCPYHTKPVANKKICHRGKKKKTQSYTSQEWAPAKLPAGTVKTTTAKPQRSIFKLPFGRTSECAAATGCITLLAQRHQILYFIATNTIDCGMSRWKLQNEQASSFPQIKMAQVLRCPRIGCNCPLELLRGKI